MNRILFDFCIFLAIALLFVQHSSSQSMAGDVQDFNYSISIGEFDATQSTIHTIEVSNENAAPFSASETEIFFVAANDLYWIKEVNALINVGRLDGFRNGALNITRIRASKWNNRIIFVADVGQSYYIYAITLPAHDQPQPKPSTIAPIQELRKHDQGRTISFMHLDEDLYCLLGEVSIAEHRSELRIFKWSRSYFQIIETIMNRDHAIDMVMLSPNQQLILIVHNQETADDDTTIQVHRYQMQEKTDNDVVAKELVTERIQDIFVPYELSTANMFQYGDVASNRLYLVTCDGLLLLAMPNSKCQFHAWKRDGIAESTRFQRLQRFPLSEAISSEAKQVQTVSTRTSVLNLDSLLAIRNGNSMLAFHGQSESRSVLVPMQNSIGISLAKKLTADAKSIVFTLININRLPTAQNGQIDLNVQLWQLFEDKIPDATLNRGGAGDIPIGSGDFAIEMSRIKAMLQDLRSHLVSDHEQYVKPMRTKVAAMKEALELRTALKDGTLGPEPISIACDQLRIVTPSETPVKTVSLNADRSHADASIAVTYERLKRTDGQKPMVRTKRLAEVEETIHVRRLTILNGNHSFKGVLLKNTTDGVYRLNGNVKAHTLRLNRVSNDGVAQPVTSDETVGSPQNAFRAIQVQSINGANWDEFVASLYRKGSATTINGNLELMYPTSIRRLQTEKLNDVSPSDYLTVATDQQIESNMFISKIHVNQIQSAVINNITRFADFVAVHGKDNVIETRVKIFVFNISDSLQLSDKEGEEMTQHIVGTRTEDLMQIYSGRIVIKGTLSLQNVQFSDAAANRSALVVDGTPFDLFSVHDQYWMKSIDQDFGHVTFTQPIRMPQLNADKLLNHPTAEYFILGENLAPWYDALSLNVIFIDDVLINGHLTSPDPSITLLHQLSETAILRNTRVSFTKPLKFSDRLIVDEITTTFDASQLVRRNNRPQFDRSVRKQFAGILTIDKNLVIDGDQMGDVTIEHFNKHANLRETLASIVTIDREQSLVGTLIFNGPLTVNNATVAYFADNPVRNQLSAYDVRFDVNILLAEIMNFRDNRIESIQINGNVYFGPDAQLTIDKLNGIALSNYLHLVVQQKQTDQKLEIFGRKTFNGDVTMQIIQAHMFNGKIHVSDWIENSLRLQKNSGAVQEINGTSWTLDYLKAENLEIRGALNGLRLPSRNQSAPDGDIIILDPTNPMQPINIQSTLQFSHGLEVGRSSDLSSDRVSKCDLLRLFGSDTIALRQTNWDVVTVARAINVLPAQRRSVAASSKSLSEFFRDAVLSESNQTIGSSDGNITIKSNGRITFNRIAGLPRERSQQPLINGINLIELYEDAVTNTMIASNAQSQPLRIGGRKTFLNEDVQFNGDRTVFAANLNAVNVAGVDILALNASLIRQADDNLVIENGRKIVFRGQMRIERLTTDAGATINGVAIDDIYYVYDETKRPPFIGFAPDASNVVVKEVEVDLVDGNSLEYFINNRMRKYAGNGGPMTEDNEPQVTTGQLTFDNLILFGPHTKINTINEIVCDDVVISAPIDNGEQQIDGIKEIMGNLFVYQPFHTWHINDIDLTSNYAKTIFLDHNQTLDQLYIQAPNRLKTSALNVRHKINGVALPDRNVFSVVPARSDRDDSDIVGATALKQLNYIDVATNFAVAFSETNLFDLNNATDVHHIWFTVDATYTEMFRHAGHRNESICPVQYHIQHDPRDHKKQQWLSLRRGSIGTRLITIDLHEKFLLHVQTEFVPATSDSHFGSKCNYKLYRKSNKPPTTRVFVNYKQQFYYPGEYIESAHAFEVAEKKHVYILLHFYNSSVTIFRGPMGKSKLSWKLVQKIPLDIHARHASLTPLFNVQLIEWQHRRTLVIAQSSPSHAGRRSRKNGEHLQLYRFNEATGKFDSSSEIDGDFDLINSIVIEHPASKRAKVDNSELHLVLAKRGGQTIQFWKADHVKTEINFRFESDLKFDAGIVSTSSFSEHDLTFLAIILNDGHFHIFQYRSRGKPADMFAPVSIHTQNRWKKKMVGQFGDGKAMIPFTADKQLYLFAFIGESGEERHAKSKGTEVAKVYKLYYY